MALLRRVLVRRAPLPSRPRRLPLPLALILGLAAAAPGATGATPSAIELAARKEQQARTLQALCESPTLARAERSSRLLLLARLELELAILRGAGLDRPATTARRLLVEAPDCLEADQAWYFLAEVELRRGRSAAALEALADLARSRPRSPLRCAGGLLAAEAWASQERHLEAAGSARGVLANRDCRDVWQQARYKLAWSLLASKQVAAGARELRVLATEPGLAARFRARVLKDLATAWALGEPDADAALFLARHGGAALVVELAEGLLARRRLASLLAITGQLLAGRAPPAQAEAVRRLRLRALGQLGSAAELERELASSGARLAAGAAEAAIAAATRLRREGSEGTRQARRLLARVAGSEGMDQATRSARIELAELMLAAGEPEAAAVQLEAARRGASRAIRLRAGHALLRGLEQILIAAPPDRRRVALGRLAEEAWRFVRDEPERDQAAQVLLTLAGRLLSGGQAEGAARAAERILAGRATSADRDSALRIALHAWDRAGRQDRVYELARTEAARGGEVSSWRAAGARAALARSRLHASRGELAEAASWAGRALAIDPRGPLAGETRLLAGILAARRGQLAEAERVFRELGESGARGGSESGHALTALGALLETRAEFAAAAAIWRRLAGSEVGEARLAHHARATRAWLAAGDRQSARAAARLLGRVVDQERLSATVRLSWQLEVASLLGEAGGPARQYLARQAHALERGEPRRAARLLLTAAASAARGKAALLERAVELAGPLRVRGAVVEVAAEARLALLRQQRARLARARPAARLAALQTIVPGLLELLAIPRLAAEVGQELELAYGALEASLAGGPAARLAGLRELRRGLRARLAALARTADGLAPVTLAAAREASSRWLPRLALVPPASTPETAAVVALAGRVIGAPSGAGSSAALGLAARSALVSLGLRADLLCARALAELSLGRPAAAWQDLEQALRLAPGDAAVRYDLAVLALWRGDFARARSLLEGQSGGSAETAAAAAAYGLGDRARAEMLARRAATGSEEARYLLALLLSERPAGRAEAIRLLQSCVDLGAATAARARARLRELSILPPREPTS